jgi:hypothetical protein
MFKPHFPFFLLVTTTLLMAPISTLAYQQIFQSQQTSTSVMTIDKRFPHVLRVNLPPNITQLTGRIELDGKVIKTLKAHPIEINLSPYLTRGKHILKISGRYFPANASVQVQVIGANTRISQQTAGSGSLNQTIIVETR